MLAIALVLAVALVAVIWAGRSAREAGPAAVPFLPAGVADGPSAAATYRWGTPQWDDEFDGTALNPDWEVYDSPGNGGNGVRSPKQVSVGDGVLTQSGTADATTAGMSLSHHDAQYGRWEARVRAIQQPGVQGRPYHVVVALIPVGISYDQGQHDIDFAETDIANGSVNLFVHYPKEKQDYVAIPLDLTQWHTFAIEVTPSHLTWYVDGVPRATDTTKDAVPESPMAFNVQLDANQPNGYIPGEVQLDWARYYPLPATDVPVVPAPKPHQGDYNPNS
ncbi:glycoside hydrolase family 16 protein [Actinomycetospora chiangmaiensis]|uniref:glycoside hydrolase family 16 protein n=1 Tax=Actinomycetospora chiangmaiensis TaxID=402650 RepID=UPI0003A92632|nr:glycoside hydrolase family 16 protein [Actinomycetospora chiangmaiensis]